MNSIKSKIFKKILSEVETKFLIWAEERYAHKKYHNWDHIKNVLWEFGKRYTLTKTNITAIVLHDALENDDFTNGIVDSSSSSSSLYVPMDVLKLIRATDHLKNEERKNLEEKLIHDADLSIFSAETFDDYKCDYSDRVRDEFTKIPDVVFIPKRIKILEGFLNRTKIYDTSFFDEKKARENITKEIEYWTELTK